MHENATNRLNLIFDTIMELDNLICDQAHSTESLDILHEDFEEDIEALVTTWYLTAYRLHHQANYNDERFYLAQERLENVLDDECECLQCECGEFDDLGGF